MIMYLYKHRYLGKQRDEMTALDGAIDGLVVATIVLWIKIMLEGAVP